MPRLDAIGVIVSDLSRWMDFYRRLGLEFPDDTAGQEHGHVEATLPGGVRLMLDTVATIESFDKSWTKPSGGHRMGIAFLCDSPADVDAVYSKLVGSHLRP
jgi:catechol 2,3-dioxygenase-like lactoylglutathione lyase family enzyme